MKLTSFKQFVKESQDTAYFTFARMNPPTLGHERLLDTIAEKAGRFPYRVYLSQTNDRKKNPLLYEDKIKIARKAFPRHGRSIRHDPSVRNILEAARAMYESGYRNVVMVGGEDRLPEFERIKLYNGKKGRHGYYMFESIKIVSAGNRDPESDDVEGVSATNLREAAKGSDFTMFSQGLPTKMTNEDAKDLYNKVRCGLGLNEEKTFKSHVSLGEKSEIREKYVRGELFTEGDEVVIKKTDEIGTISVLGANYVIVETADGKRSRKWLDDVEALK